MQGEVWCLSATLKINITSKGCRCWAIVIWLGRVSCCHPFHIHHLSFLWVISVKGNNVHRLEWRPPLPWDDSQDKEAWLKERVMPGSWVPRLWVQLYPNNPVIWRQAFFSSGSPIPLHIGWPELAYLKQGLPIQGPQANVCPQMCFRRSRKTVTCAHDTHFSFPFSPLTFHVYLTFLCV